MAGKKREAKTIVSTPSGLMQVRVIIDFTPEDMIEHMCTCALSELGAGGTYSELPDKSVLNRGLKAKLVDRKRK